MDDNGDLTTRVRASLKEKWMHDDHDIDINRMAEYFGVGESELTGIIRQYESELLNTKFNLK